MKSYRKILTNALLGSFVYLLATASVLSILGMEVSPVSALIVYGPPMGLFIGLFMHILFKENERMPRAYSLSLSFGAVFLLLLLMAIVGGL